MIDDRFRTEKLKEEMMEYFKSCATTLLYAGVITPEEFDQKTIEIESIKDMTFEEFHEYYDIYHEFNLERWSKNE